MKVEAQIYSLLSLMIFYTWARLSLVVGTQSLSWIFCGKDSTLSGKCSGEWAAFFNEGYWSIQKENTEQSVSAQNVGTEEVIGYEKWTPCEFIWNWRFRTNLGDYTDIL